MRIFYKLPHTCPRATENSHITYFAFKGRALGDIDEITGEFKLRLEGPKEIVREGAEMKVKTFPLKRETEEIGVIVYPELKQGDEVIVAGFWAKNIQLHSVIIKNLTNGIKSIFIDEQIKIKKGFLSSFVIRHPFLVKAEKRIENIMAT